MVNVQSASHGTTCTNEYFLTTKVLYDVCCNCEDDNPTEELALTIVPLCNPALFGFQPQSGWTPTELGNFHFNIKRKDHIQSDSKHEITRKTPYR